MPETGEEIREELKRRFGDDILFRIDGDFNGSQFPPRDQIASVKVIKNAFDAEFRMLASLIFDIRTKAVANDLRGLVNLRFNDEILNARNPLDSERRATQRKQVVFGLSGPILAKLTSFNVLIFANESDETQRFWERVSMRKS